MPALTENWACHDLFVVYNIDHNYTKVFHNIGVVHLKEDDHAPVVIPYLFKGGGINPLQSGIFKSENTEKPMIACDEFEKRGRPVNLLITIFSLNPLIKWLKTRLLEYDFCVECDLSQNVYSLLAYTAIYL